MPAVDPVLFLKLLVRELWYLVVLKVLVRLFHTLCGMVKMVYRILEEREKKYNCSFDKFILESVRCLKETKSCALLIKPNNMLNLLL